MKHIPNRLFPFLWQYLRPHKLYLAGFFVVALVWAIEMSLSPYLLKVIIDKSSTQAILIPAIIYVSMSILLNLNFRMYDYVNLRLYPQLKAAVTRDMFSHLISHSYEFFQNHFAGSLARKIFDMSANIDQIVSIFNEWFYPRFIALLIASLTLFYAVKPIFGIILFVWSIIFIGLSFYAAKTTQHLARINSESATKLSGTLIDSLTNIVSTKLFSNVNHEIERLDKELNHLVNTDRAVRWSSLIFNFYQGVGVTVLIATMLTFLIHGRTQGSVSPGDFALVLMLSITFANSVFNIGNQMLQFSKVVGICNQALSFIQTPHEIIDNVDAQAIVINSGKIQFRNIVFQYENSNVLFNQLNVTIQPGQRVGLVGYTGSGKSSFIKLILRLVDPQSGAVLIDEHEIKTVTQNSLRKQIGTIPQEPELFHRTIMENIRFAKPDASDAEVIDAAKQAKCHDFISELPEQYQSLVGERGIKLSGGQKQRIAIARAFLKNAPILILDEATSSLDSITERHIQESLHEVMLHRTTLVIAHRLSTLKDMDRILVFANGEIVQDGTLSELLRDSDGDFYKLWQMQAEGFIP